MVINLKRLEINCLAVVITICMLTLAVTNGLFYFALVYSIFMSLMIFYYHIKATLLSLNSVYVNSNKLISPLYDEQIKLSKEKKRQCEIELESIRLFMNR